MAGRRGFSFLEVLVALAILTLLSVSLMPLLIRLAASDRQTRSRAESWRAAQSALVALYLDDQASWKNIESRTGRQVKLETEIATGGTAWNKLTVLPPDGALPELRLYLEHPAATGPRP